MIPKIIMNKIISLAQEDRNKNGDWENEIIKLGQPYGVIDARKDEVIDPLTGKYFKLDARLNDILIELTTSCGDTKEAKIIREAELFKKIYPDSKFVVCLKRIKSNKGKGRVRDGLDSHYDHLIKHPYIDNVLLGEEEIIRFFINPFWDKEEKIKKLINANKQININNNNIGDNNMDFKQSVIEQAIKNGTVEAARFLTLYENERLNFGMSNVTSGVETSEYSKIKEKISRRVALIREKNPPFITNTDNGYITIKEWGRRSGYKDSTLKKSSTTFGGKLGKELANGISIYTNTTEPDWDNPSKLLNQLMVNANQSTVSKGK